jgi:hypothetical protein
MLAKLSIPALLTILFCLLSNSVKAQESGYKNKQGEYTDIKCHVVLTSGKAMISLWRIDRDKLTNIKQWIVGKQVTLPDSTKPSVIYKALSCIAGDAEFTSAKAKLLDENTAR